MNTWASKLFDFYTNLQLFDLPDDIKWLYPQKDKQVQDILNHFLHRYYADNNERTLLLGINPGRHGAGITGINFTAARQLREDCGIENPFKGSELSAEFIYQVIHAYGGVQAFYSKFFIGAVCPLGFVRNGKNINYYDHPLLSKTVEPFIIQNLSWLNAFNINKQQCICIGGEKNFKYLSLHNNRYNWFNEIISLPHPRFIMQYKRKKLPDYINLYLDVLQRK